MSLAVLARILARQEGIRYLPYRDTNQYWTIGIGHLISLNTYLTFQQACDLCAAPWNDAKTQAVFAEDVNTAREAIAHAYPHFLELPDTVQDGLIDMSFQMGIGHLLGFHDMFKALDVDDFSTAEAAALDSVWGRGPTQGRAQEVAAMIGNRTA